MGYKKAPLAWKTAGGFILQTKQNLKEETGEGEKGIYDIGEKCRFIVEIPSALLFGYC